MLGHLLDHDDKAFVIAAHGDMELLRIFLGERMNRVIPADENSALQIRRACCADPNSYMPSADSGIVVRSSPQRGCIRPLHIVDYPYFVELNSSRYVRYLDLQRMIMHIPGDARMAMPSFLNKVDEECAESVLEEAGLLNCKCAIINPVNFSHHPLSFEALTAISDRLRHHGYKVGFNVAQASDPEMGKSLHERTGASILSMPGHLMKTIYDKIDLCIGALGGALAIADAFSSCSVLVIHTQSNFFPMLTEFCKYDDSYKFENFEAEPRPLKPRLYRATPLLSGSAAEEIDCIGKELGDMLTDLQQL